METVSEICLGLERNICLECRFKGLVRLSHQRYDLYQPFWDPSARDGPRRDQNLNLHQLMTCLPRYLDGNTTMLEVAERHGLPLRQVYEYAMKWVDCGLAEVARRAGPNGPAS